MNIIEQNKSAIEALCLKHRVEHLDAFGSVLTDKFNEKSDVDFLVVFSGVNLDQYADNFLDFIESLEKLLDRKVDVIPEKKITNPYLLKSINRNRINVYDRRDPGLAA
jgi:hypothetical protein